MRVSVEGGCQAKVKAEPTVPGNHRSTLAFNSLL